MLSLFVIKGGNVLLVLLNNTFRPYLKTIKKGPHIRGAGWWGILFLNQFLKKCNPLPIAQILDNKYTTDSALTIFIYVYL